MNGRVDMKSKILRVLAMIMPCGVFFIQDDPITGFFVLILQASLVGWIPACIWAWRTIPSTPKRTKQSKGR